MVTKQPRAGAARPGSRLLAAGWLLCAGAVLAMQAHDAGAVTCTAAVDRSRAAPGDRLVLTVTVEGEFANVSPPPAPAISGVQIFGGGTSRGFTLADGRLQGRAVFTYHLVVERAESFTIPALEIEVEGRAYRTQPIPIDVASSSPPGGRPSTPAAPPTAGAPPPTTGAAPGNVGGGRPGDDIFITLEPDKRRAWVGEQVVLIFRFHRRVQLWDSPQFRPPRSEGFWREDMPPERTSMQVIAGQRYHVTEIRYALFPTRAGELTIEPAEVTVPEDVFDRFFGRQGGRSAGRRLRTPPVTIAVQELPAPQPAGFSGVVASRLELSAKVDRAAVPRGEAATLRVALTADGFLKSLEGLQLPQAQGVRVHDAAEGLEVDKSGDRLLSRYTVEKVLVPSREGEVQLPPVTLLYFNPARGTYVTARAEARSLVVTPGTSPGGEDEPSSFVRGEIERLGQDLAFIKSAGGRLARRARPLPESPAWWISAGAPLLLLLCWRWRLSQVSRQQSDPLGARRRAALAQARRKLRAARRAATRTASLERAGAAIAGYVGDRTGRAAASISAEDVRGYGAGIGREIEGCRLAEIYLQSQTERYAAGAAAQAEADASTSRALIAEAERLLQELERAAGGGVRRRSGRGAAHVWLLFLMWTAGTLSVALGSRPSTAAAGPEGHAGRRGSPEQLLAEGNNLYTGGDIDAALLRYEAALAAGADDPVVHYNLGNAHARRGELGRAIASYLRARRLAPRDADLRANLAWVRSNTRDLELQPQRLPPGIAQLAEAVRFLSLDEWSIVVLALLWLVCGQMAWRWRRMAPGDVSRRLLLASAAALCAAIAVAVWRYHDERVKVQAVVVAPEVDVRSGPSDAFPVVFKMHDGLVLTVRGRRDDWRRIGLGGAWVGWVPASSLEEVRRPRTAGALLAEPSAAAAGRQDGPDDR